MKKQKTRLDALLVQRGMAPTIREAQAAIMAGDVAVASLPGAKAGTLIDTTAEITLKAKNPYVSRGGLKLEAALKSFGVTVAGSVCMDIGASTGGFTDCLLQHGARKVYALDVGQRLLDGKLAADPRVISIEGVNFRYFSRESINQLKEPIEFVTIDVSFISLKKILPVVIKCAPRAAVIAMVKPQFEAEPAALIKGVVRDEDVRRKTIDKVKAFAQESGYCIEGEMDSPVKGPKGNREHFLRLRSCNAL